MAAGGGIIGMQVNRAVKVLDISVYGLDGRKGATIHVPHPSWKRIVQAIRELDQYCRPCVFLRLHEDNPEKGWLSVLGGNGVYSITGTLNGLDHLTYFDRTMRDDDVPVWTSDQGFYPPEKNVCYDLRLVLRVARHWAEHGAFDPSVQWEP